jgi:hypothetical protein
MKRYGLILIGAALALGGMALAVRVYTHLLVHSPFSLGAWKTHSSLLFYASEMIAFVPFILLLGIIFWHLFSSRRILHSFFSVLVALLVSIAAALDDPRAIVGVLTEMPEFWVTYLLGVPGVVYVFDRLRSNYRLERP